MSAVVLPFRFACRVQQIWKTAAYMASLPQMLAEGHLRGLRDSLRNKIVAEPLIWPEVASYEGAARANLWRLILARKGGAS